VKGRDIVPAKDLTQVRDTVGISLIGSAETAVAIEMVAEEMPDAKITDNDCFYKVERDGLLRFDMADLSERLGRDYTVHDFLVNMTSYYGRIVVSDAAVEIRRHPARAVPGLVKEKDQWRRNWKRSTQRANGTTGDSTTLAPTRSSRPAILSHRMARTRSG
jgi:propane monooxygenase coupling protein